MNSLEKMLSLLDVFTPAASTWSSDELIAYSGSSRSTCYRYIKVLQDAGFLAPVANGSYVLGPRIMELDRYIRMCDPIYIGGGPAIQKLARKTGHTVRLYMLYSNMLICVREEQPPSEPTGLFTRGQKRPLLVGAGSKVVLAYLPVHQLRSIFAHQRKAIAAAGLGADWKGFLKVLRRIRDDGYCVTSGELTPGLVGISAPLFDNQGKVLGSLAVALAESGADRSKFPVLAAAVAKAAQEASTQIGSGEHGVLLPARAVR